MSAHVGAEAPDIAIRERPPRPKRLSRKMLLAGVLAAGGIMAFALWVGLSERTSPVMAAESRAGAAQAPQTIEDAAAQYGADELAPPEMFTDAASNDAGALTLGEEATSFAPAQPPIADEAAPAAPILFALPARPPSLGAHTARLSPPASRYEIKAGDTISAALVTALNSDAEGRVVAQVTAPVYDSLSGDHLLIPQGARLLGAYSSAVRYGDERIVVVWDRLILPNGWSIELGAMQATDAQGAAGISDTVDHHLDRLGIAVVLSSLMSVMANESEDESNDVGLRASVADAAAQQAAQTGARIVERDLAVRPTLRVRAGASVRVLVTRDLVLAPYAPSR